MHYLKKLSSNKTERAVQEHYHSLGYTSIKRGWPDFCFWKKEPGKKAEYIFVEVKPAPPLKGTPFRKKKTYSQQNVLTPPQRKIKNIFKSLGLDFRVAFGVNNDGSPNYEVPRAGINKTTPPFL